jgi:predicted HTH transcriptional regulator
MDISLPELPSAFSAGQLFPYPEGALFEFKESHVSTDLKKIHETICAFLNVSGGYMIFGVKDTGEVCGISRSGVDKLLLRADEIIHQKRILDAETGCAISPEILSSWSIKLSNVDKYLVIMKAVRAGATSMYRLSTGEKMFRLSASNYRSAAAGRTHSVLALQEENDLLQENIQKLVDTVHAKNKEFLKHNKTLRQAEQENNSLANQLRHVTRLLHASESSRAKQTEFIGALKSKYEQSIKDLHEKILAEKACAEEALSKQFCLCGYFTRLFC